jgi:acyl carrier protein
MKKHTEYVEEVTTIVADQFCMNEDQIVLDAPLRQQGADSLDMIELIMAFEEDFGVDVSDAEVDDLKTVNDIVAFLENTLGVAE